MTKAQGYELIAAIWIVAGISAPDHVSKTTTVVMLLAGLAYSIGAVLS